MTRTRLLAVTTDAALALAAATAGVLLAVGGDRALWTTVAAQIAGAAALLVRRRRPYGMALVIAAVNLVAPAWATVLAPFAVTRYAAGPVRRQAGVVLLLAVTFLIGARAWRIDDPFTAPIVIGLSALLGLYARTRRSLLAELTDRVERAERERLLLAEQARADERIRLAGEMHDVVTHRINLLVLQAGALRTTAPDEATRAAAESMRVAGCEALAELRDLVGVLRTGPAEPGDDDLDRLVAGSRAVGLPVRLELSGDPAGPAPAVRRTVYRVIQESLTNVHKHAPGSSAVVTVEYGAADVRVAVCNDAPRGTPRTAPLPAGAGSGLAGLRHRVEVVGGELSAGPAPGGGFAVRATLPAYVPTAAAS